MTADKDRGPIIGGKPLRRGARIGPYVYEREVGAGGMAHVLLASAPDGTRVALKVLKANRFQTGLARFRREFHALSRLSHPNIIRVDAYGDLHGHPYIAMEFVDGPDLHTVIREFRNWDDAIRYRRCEEILVDLCRALSVIHRRGLVHRDLKPSNILLTREGVAKLTDFGIVKDLDPRRDPHLSTTLVGTWAYTSPEHISGQSIDHRSDLYSLGVILFALLTGKRPFVAENMAGYLEQHRNKKPPRAARVRPGVPRHLDEICARLLKKAPKDRFQSAQEILYRLEADDLGSTDELSGSWEPPLLGNREAIDLVEEAIAALTDRRGGVVRIMGNDGSGKTRLLQLAVDRARMLGLPYHLHTFEPGQPVFSVAIQLAHELLRELPATSSTDLRKIVLAYAEGSSLRGDTRYALYDAIKGAIEEVLEERPRVFILDDVHHAPPPELHLFHYVLRGILGTDNAPMLFLVSRRAGTEPEAENHQRKFGVIPTDVELRQLTRAEVRMMVSSLIGVGRAAQLIAERLHAESEGNPYFAAEYLRSLISQHLIARTARGWQLLIDPAELAAGHLEVPPGIRQMLRTRLEGIDPSDHRILDVLAVSGQRTDLDVLLEVLDEDEEDVLHRLDNLIVAGLVREYRSNDALDYQIDHRQLADIVRRELPEERRTELHRRLATALEEISAHDPERLVVIGEHFRQANEAGRAYVHLVSAARRLLERSMAQEASVLAEKAAQVEIAAQADLPREEYCDLRMAQLRVQGTQLHNEARWDQASAVYTELLALAEEVADERASCDARLELSTALRRRGMHERSLDEAHEALRIARRIHYRRGVAESLHNLSALAWLDGDLEQCEALANEGLLVTQGPQLAEQRARLLLSLTSAQATRGQLASATRGLVEAEQIFAELRMKRPRVLALANVAELLVWQGDPEEALDRSEEAGRLGEELGYRLGSCAALRAQGVALLELGRYWAAHNALLAAHELAVEIDLPEEAIAASVALTQLAIERHDPMGAIRHGALGLSVAEQRDPEQYTTVLQALLSRALAQTRPELAWTLLQAVEDAIPTLHTPRQTQVRLAASWAWLALGEKENAIAHAEEVIRSKSARSFRLIQLEARALLANTTTGETSRRHQRLGSELAKDFTEALPVATSGEVRRRPFFRFLESEDTATIVPGEL